MAKPKPLSKISPGTPLLLQKQEAMVATSGPIPDAAALAAYGKVRADLPDIIIEEWRIEAATRRELERKNAELAEREVAIREKTADAVMRHNTVRLAIGAMFMGGSLFLSWLLVQSGHIEPAIIMTALPAVAAILSAGLKFLKK